MAESRKSRGLEKRDSRLIKIRVAWKTFDITSCYKNILFNPNTSLIQMRNVLRLGIVYDNANSKTRRSFTALYYWCKEALKPSDKFGFIAVMTG